MFQIIGQILILAKDNPNKNKEQFLNSYFMYQLSDQSKFKWKSNSP